jgi:hypothetical protein
MFFFFLRVASFDVHVQQRPSFSDIEKVLRNLIVTLALPEQHAAEFWSASFGPKVLSSRNPPRPTAAFGVALITL